MKVFIQIVLFVSSVLLVGCGGGGSSSSGSNGLTYNGKTTAAKLDKTSAKSFVEFVLDSSENSSLTSSDSTTNKVSKSFQKQSKIINGSTGTLDITRTTIDNVTTKIVAIFKNYSENYDDSPIDFGDGDFTAPTLTGTITYIITVATSSSDIIKNMKMTLSLVNIKSTTSDVTIDGVINISNDYTVNQSTSTQNLIIQNNKSSESFKLENFVIVADENDRAISYTGKVYNSSEGYVVITTPVKLSYDEGTYTPNVGGEILFEGDDAFARERIAYDGTVRVEIDNGKDGIVDEVEVYNIETLEVVPNRAAVITIIFPSKIYTDTNMSETNITIYDPDLDTFSSVYEWKVNDVIKSKTFNISNELFKKHERLKLIVTATDDSMKGNKVATKNLEQIVLNSKPTIKINVDATGLIIDALSIIEFDVSQSTDSDNDVLSYQWEVYKYIHESESSEGELIHQDTDTYSEGEEPNQELPSVSGYSLYKVNANKYFNSIVISKPSYKAISEGKHIIKCIVSDDDLASDDEELIFITKKLDLSIEENTVSKVFFANQADLYEWTQNTIRAFDLNKNGEKELIYLTRNPADYTGDSLLHISSNIKSENSITNSILVDISTSDNIEFVDFNANGRIDIMLVGTNNRFVILQKEDGSFENPLEIQLNRNVVYMNDYNNDGITDSVKLEDCSLNIFTDFNDTSKFVQYDLAFCEEGEEGHTLKVGDLNNDGVDDFIILTHNHITLENEFIIIYKDTNGTLVETESIFLKEKAFSETISIGDVNGDSINDVIIDFVLFEGKKDFKFLEVKTLETYKNGSTNSDIVISDMNNDEKQEIFYENGGILRVLLQEENFVMNDFKIKNIILSRVITDIDNDGKVEIIEHYGNRIDISTLK